MKDQRRYPPGVPSWVDTDQPDVEAARRFYETLFGWTFADAIPADAPGTYLIASLDGADVAAIGPGQRAEWNTYIAVDDADAVAKSVAEAGGTVTVEPVDAGPGGRLPVAPTRAGRGSGCGSRAIGLARSSSTLRAAGTSAICTPATSRPPGTSTRRCSDGSSTMSGSGR